jgi:hypothetical protein
MLADWLGADQPLIINNPIQGSSWNLNQTLRNLRIPQDGQGNIWVLPTMAINPNNNPINAAAATQIVDNGSPVTTVGPNFGFVGTGASYAAATTRISLPIASLAALLDVNAGAYYQQEQASLDAANTVTGAASANILASGGAGKKWRLFGLYGTLSATAAVAACSVNEATSGHILWEGTLGAAGSVAFNINYGPNGILQANANNAIQMTTVANATMTGTLVYGAAR